MHFFPGPFRQVLQCAVYIQYFLCICGGKSKSGHCRQLTLYFPLLKILFQTTKDLLLNSYWGSANYVCHEMFGVVGVVLNGGY